MNEQELQQKIVDYIKTIYNANYNGFIKVNKEIDNYVLSLGIPSYMQLTTIGGQFNSDEDFLDYIYKELRERNYMKVYFYKVTRIDEKFEK